MSDLFDWSEQVTEEPAKPAKKAKQKKAKPEATILPFCIHKHVSIERMAQRIARYDEKRALAALHSEGEASFKAWVAAGYPEHIAQNLACQYEVALLRRLAVLFGYEYEGDAAS